MPRHKSTKPYAPRTGARPKQKLAAYWYDRALREGALVGQLERERDQARADVRRIDGMFQAQNNHIAGVKRALAVVASYEPDRWSDELACFKTPKPKG